MFFWCANTFSTLEIVFLFSYSFFVTLLTHSLVKMVLILTSMCNKVISMNKLLVPVKLL
jgi:hypothetical protein